MSPRTRKPKRASNGASAHDDPNRKVFVTSRGVTVILAPYPALSVNAQREALEDEWREDGRALPRKPTYELKTVAGETETHEHDETTIRGDKEATAAWAAWEADQAAFEREANERSLRTFILDCMTFEVDPKWEAKARAKRVRVPADEFARKIFWAETEVLGTSDDYLTAMSVAAEMAGATEQQMNAVRDSFRREVAKPGGNAG